MACDLPKTVTRSRHQSDLVQLLIELFDSSSAPLLPALGLAAPNPADRGLMGFACRKSSMLHAVCCVPLRAAWSMAQATRCIRNTCCTLHGACCMAHVAWRMTHAFVEWSLALGAYHKRRGA